MLLLFSSACQSYLSLVLLEQVQLSMRKITTKTAIHKEVMYKHFRKKKKLKAKWPLILFDSIPSKLPPLTSSEIAYLLNREDEGACSCCCFLEKNSCMKKHSHIVTLFKNILFRPTVKKFQRAWNALNSYVGSISLVYLFRKKGSFFNGFSSILWNQTVAFQKVR